MDTKTDEERENINERRRRITAAAMKAKNKLMEPEASLNEIVKLLDEIMGINKSLVQQGVIEDAQDEVPTYKLKADNTVLVAAVRKDRIGVGLTIMRLADGVRLDDLENGTASPDSVETVCILEMDEQQTLQGLYSITAHLSQALEMQLTLLEGIGTAANEEESEPDPGPAA
jgi:hypothetical protein